MEIKVLGPGCANCKALERNVINALAELNLEADVQKVEDIMQIMSFGALRTPGLVINDKLVSSGRLLNTNEIKNLIEKNK